VAEDFEVAFLVGVAQLLADATSATWRSNGAYGPGETGIVLESIPQGPDAVMVLAAYGADDDPSLSDSVLGLQVTTRRPGQDPRPGIRLAGEVFDALHGLEQVDLATGVRLVHCLRRSHTSIGQDQNGRWRRVQNFYCDVHRPSTHRH
jgi:hypothetical protein